MDVFGILLTIIIALGLIGVIVLIVVLVLRALKKYFHTSN